ncbi:DNA ligase [Haematococcus lacustris]|uniref:DNA ligase n=1 Tax=Haematococcus lacustris TaxID=44745 RepID=A0A699ZHY3_HAELA|nr:DNA ligase [Haematococcus lacustris]
MAIITLVAPSHQGVELGMGESTLIKDGGVGLADRLERSAQAVKAAYSECPSYDEVVPALLSYGPWELSQHCHFKPSVPVKPMLAKPTTEVEQAT